MKNHLLAVFLVSLSTPALADDLFSRMEAAQTTIDMEIYARAGNNPRAARWSEARRAQSQCALAELTNLRGRRTAEKYVTALEGAALRAPSIKQDAQFGGLSAQVHTEAGIKLRRDLVPITRKCGIGL